MSHAFPLARLPWRDTPRTYGRVTRILHWAIAALILWQFLGMALKLIFGRQPALSFIVGSHQPVGTVLFGLILLRVLWALANRGARPRHEAGLIGLAARLGHLALYGLMLIVPAAALLRAYGSKRPFAPFGREIFPAREPEIEWTVKLADALHGELAWLMGALILGHVFMVAVHERLWRDGTLGRMAGRPGSAPRV